MSYLKLPTTVQDHAIGFQSVNQAIDNNTSNKDLYDAKHSLGQGGNSGGFSNPFLAVGRHDDPLIARTVVRYTVNTTPLVPTARAVVSGPMVNLSPPVRIVAGQWRIFIYTPQMFGAIALLNSTSSVDRKATCYIEQNPLTGPSVLVSTWNVATAALADLDFSLVLFKLT